MWLPQCAGGPKSAEVSSSLLPSEGVRVLTELHGVQCRGFAPEGLQHEDGDLVADITGDEMVRRKSSLWHVAWEHKPRDYLEYAGLALRQTAACPVGPLHGWRPREHASLAPDIQPSLLLLHRGGVLTASDAERDIKGGGGEACRTLSGSNRDVGGFHRGLGFSQERLHVNAQNKDP